MKPVFSGQTAQPAASQVEDRDPERGVGGDSLKASRRMSGRAGTRAYL